MQQEFSAQQTFDAEKARQLINGTGTVFHCHHYSTLFTQLADDAKEFKGAQLLAEAAEDFAYRELTAYFEAKNVKGDAERVATAESYFGFIGLGVVKVSFDGKGGSAEMKHSHVDEGWIKKWGKRDRSVNFIGRGFLAGACAAVSNSKPGSFSVEETQSIVSGSPSSKFVISAKRANP